MQKRTSKRRFTSSLSYCIVKALQLFNFGLSNSCSPRFLKTLEIVVYCSTIQDYAYPVSAHGLHCYGAG